MGLWKLLRITGGIKKLDRNAQACQITLKCGDGLEIFLTSFPGILLLYMLKTEKQHSAPNAILTPSRLYFWRIKTI